MENEKEFITVELSDLSHYCASIVNNHKECEGRGVRLKDGSKNQFEVCDCVVVFDYVKELVYSRLPKRHWDVKLTYKSFVKFASAEQKKIFGEFYEDPFGQNFVIEAGLMFGKTRALTMIGKHSILSGMNVFYITSSDLINCIKEDSNDNSVLMERLKNADLVLVDDVDRIPKYEWAAGILIKELKIMFDRGVASVVCLSDTSGENEAVAKVRDLVLAQGTQVSIKMDDKNSVIRNYLNPDFLKESVRYKKYGNRAVNRGKVNV
jgi:hypothetical protein